MGLDISAYRQAKKLDAAQLDENGEPVDYVRIAYGRVFDNTDFPGRNDGLENGYYSAAEGMVFRAGSYGGYNRWRDELAQLVGAPGASAYLGESGRSGPFAELINFSDCEGTIGPVTSAKLAKDFADFQHVAGETGYFAESYALWRKAFEMAADGGFVDFH